MATNTFIIDCHTCKARVAAVELGRAEEGGLIDEPYGYLIQIGKCPSCQTILVGESNQIEFEGWGSYVDVWSNVIRVFPKPPKSFISHRIPRVVTDSLNEADRSLQAGANIAACVMLGRALEAVCRNILESDDRVKNGDAETFTSKKKLMLASGIKKLREKNIIDDRLYNWSQQLHAFRNLAAHPEDISISREDAEDLQTFVYAIVEYIYDLTDRYEDFKLRVEEREKRKDEKRAKRKQA